MKTLTTLIVLIITFSEIYSSQDSTYPQSMTIFNKDTIHYYWQIKHYTDLGNLNIVYPRYNGKIWISGVTTRAFVSYDNLESWKAGVLPPASNFFKRSINGFCLLPNNKIIVTQLDKKDTVDYTRLFETYDITKGWTELNPENFKNKFLGSIAFKDSLNGIIVVSDELTYRNLYRTENGGSEWYRLDNISDFLETDTNFIMRIEYFKESDVLMCIIYNIPSKSYYFIFSKDFGDTWTELRSFPKRTNNVIDYTRDSGFFIRNDTLWFVGAVGTGNGIFEIYQSIYFSSDLGKTWETQYLAIPDKLGALFSSIEFFDNSQVGLVCEKYSPRVMITFSGGKYWTFLKTIVTGYGAYNDSLFDEYQKFALRKANNQMIFFGANRVFKFNNLNLPTGVGEDEENNISLFYNSGAEAVEVKSNSNEIIQQITFYDVTGRELYTSTDLPNSHFFISQDKLQNTKVVFAIIYTNHQMYLKQIICG
ncbi:MAG: sialidase family protein [Candidatus Kapabacteria bacterium]|nr:sialidase family protein [Candidatus Kapabacteria bacterium]